MENDLLLEKLSDLQREQTKEPLVHERSLFLMGLFNGDRGLSQLTRELAQELEISLDPDREALSGTVPRRPPASAECSPCETASLAVTGVPHNGCCIQKKYPGN